TCPGKRRGDGETMGNLSSLYRLAPAFGDGHHDGGQGEQGDGVGADHEVVEQVGETPHQVVGHGGAQEDEHQSQHAVHGGGLFAEQVHHVDLAEQVPAQHSGEGEEEQADGHEDGAKVGAEHGAKGGLGQVGAVEGGGDVPHIAPSQGAVVGVQGGDDHQGVEGEYHKGVDEHADHGHHTLLVGVFHVGLSVGVGGGAHACLVG